MTRIHEHTRAVQRPILLGIGPASSAQELLVLLERVVEAGFDGVEVALPVPAGDGVAGVPRWLQDLLTTQARSNPPVCAVAGRCLTTNLDAAIDTVKSLLEQSAAVSARCLNLTIPPLRGVGPAGSESRGGGFGRYQQALNFAYALLRRLRFESEATGVALAIEAGGDGTLLSPVELRELIDEANSWAVGVCIDVGRIARFALPSDWLLTLRHRVQAVRIPQQVPADPPGGPIPVRPVDFAEIGDTLDEIGFTGPIIVDGWVESMVDW